MNPATPPQAYEGFTAACQRHAQAKALQIGQRQWTYSELNDWSLRLAALLSDILHLHRSAQPQRVGVLASRSMTAFGATLAVFATGATFVALNPAYPPARNAAIIRRAGIRCLIVGAEGRAQLQPLQELCDDALTVIAPESEAKGPKTPSNGVALDSSHLAASQALVPSPLSRPDDDLAYLVFTSGSTGEPKGVAITHQNFATYLHNFSGLAPTCASDRVATTFELTFDVALHDMFVTWMNGATLVVLPERAMLAPARFIIDERITVWFSVASFAMILQKQGLLRPGLFPELRLSLLCGEALPLATAVAWAAAAPNSELFNVWGPTETTMELSFYRWHRSHSEAHCKRGVVPIGVPFADHQHLLLDEQGREVTGPGEGELYVSGPQVGPGYWQDPERTATSFKAVPDHPGTWYKSGDRVERDALGVYHFISRVDSMVKVRGNRIELGDVEHALRKASGHDLVAVVTQPALDGLAQGLVGFVCSPENADRERARIREQLKPLLPKAWLPDDIRVLPHLPLNANRKIDRSALAAMLG